MMPEISIIVPVYQVEDYLQKCIDSILNQTFTDFELILVDDGSSDRSALICDHYQQQDSRVVVLHKKNGGLSSARNAGLNQAHGKYIGFVDSDDYISPTMYEVLHQNIVDNDADLSICGIYDIYGQETPRKKEYLFEVLSRDAATLLILQGNNISVHAVNKLYKKQIFSTVRYPIGKYHEDSYVILDVLEKCEKIVINSCQLYFYVHREGSINTENFSSKQFDFIDAWRQNEQRLQNKSKELRAAAHQRVCFANFLVLDKLLNSNNSEEYGIQRHQIVSYLRSNFLFIMLNSIFTTSRKLALLLLMINFKLYKYVIKLHKN